MTEIDHVIIPAGSYMRVVISMGEDQIATYKIETHARADFDDNPFVYTCKFPSRAREYINWIKESWSNRP